MKCAEELKMRRDERRCRAGQRLTRGGDRSEVIMGKKERSAGRREIKVGVGTSLMSSGLKVAELISDPTPGITGAITV